MFFQLYSRMTLIKGDDCLMQFYFIKYFNKMLTIFLHLAEGHTRWTHILIKRYYQIINFLFITPSLFIFSFQHIDEYGKIVDFFTFANVYVHQNAFMSLINYSFVFLNWTLPCFTLGWYAFCADVPHLM